MGILVGILSTLFVLIAVGSISPILCVVMVVGVVFVLVSIIASSSVTSAKKGSTSSCSSSSDDSYPSRPSGVPLGSLRIDSNSRGEFITTPGGTKNYISSREEHSSPKSGVEIAHGMVCDVADFLNKK